MKEEKTLQWKPQKPLYRKYKKGKSDEALTGHFLFQIGESENLRKSSAKILVEKITTPEYKKKIAYMRKCILEYKRLTNKGRAVAGVQVGLPEEILAVLTPEKKQKTWLIINPVITRRSEILLRYPEMCMSCNGLIAYVVRPSWIEFNYYDEKGEKQFWNTKDTTKSEKMYNRVLQHEIDHLHGIINIDLVPSKELIFISDPHFYEKADFEKVHPDFAKTSSRK